MKGDLCKYLGVEAVRFLGFLGSGTCRGGGFLPLSSSSLTTHHHFHHHLLHHTHTFPPPPSPPHPSHLPPSSSHLSRSSAWVGGIAAGRQEVRYSTHGGQAGRQLPLATTIPGEEQKWFQMLAMCSDPNEKVNEQLNAATFISILLQSLCVTLVQQEDKMTQ